MPLFGRRMTHHAITLSVDLAEHDVQRAQDGGRRPASHMPAIHIVHRLEMRETGRADLAAIGLVGAVGDEIDAELALGASTQAIDLTRPARGNPLYTA